MKDHYESKTGETVVTARLPVHIEVQDYHEFPEVQDHLRKLVPDIKVKEIGCGCPIDRQDLSGAYHGVAYVGRLTDPSVAGLIKEIKEHCKDD